MNKVDEVNKNIYRIQVPIEGSPLRFINSYLIKGTDEYILIDTGYNTEECLNVLKESLSYLNVDLGKLDIVLTHFHNDHAGAAPELIRPGKNIYVPEKEFINFGIGIKEDTYNVSRKSRYLQEGINEEEFDQIMYTGHGINRGPNLFNKQYKAIKEGTVFEIGGYSLEAIHTPGHTPGHMCFYDKKKSLLFTGDHILYDVSSNITVWTEVKDSLGDYLRSLNETLRLNVDTAYPGHRNSGDTYSRIVEQLKHHKERLNECKTIIKNNPKNTAIDITGMLQWNLRPSDNGKVPLRLLKYAFGETLAHLDYLCINDNLLKTFKNGAYRYYYK